MRTEEQKARMKAYHAEWYQRNKARVRENRKAWDSLNREAVRSRSRERYNPVAQRRSWNKYRYGITDEQFDDLLKSQKGACAVCGSKFSEDRKPHIDHCHNTRVVRGLLCSNCNYCEGRLKTVENARKLYEYMLRNEIFYQGRN